MTANTEAHALFEWSACHPFRLPYFTQGFVPASCHCSHYALLCNLTVTCTRYGEAGLKGGLGGMGGQGGEAYGSPFDIFEQFFGGAGELIDARM